MSEPCVNSPGPSALTAHLLKPRVENTERHTFPRWLQCFRSKHKIEVDLENIRMDATHMTSIRQWKNKGSQAQEVSGWFWGTQVGPGRHVGETRTNKPQASLLMLSPWAWSTLHPLGLPIPTPGVPSHCPKQHEGPFLHKAFPDSLEESGQLPRAPLSFTVQYLLLLHTQRGLVK